MGTCYKTMQEYGSASQEQQTSKLLSVFSVLLVYYLPAFVVRTVQHFNI